MINSSNTINIDGNVIDHEEIVSALKFEQADGFTRWVLRPLALLCAVGIVIAGFFASAVLVLLSLAMLPLLGLSMWAVKSKLERDAAKQEPIVHVQE